MKSKGKNQNLFYNLNGKEDNEEGKLMKNESVENLVVKSQPLANHYVKYYSSLNSDGDDDDCMNGFCASLCFCCCLQDPHESTKSTSST